MNGRLIPRVFYVKNQRCCLWHGTFHKKNTKNDPLLLLGSFSDLANFGSLENEKTPGNLWVQDCSSHGFIGTMAPSNLIHFGTIPTNVPHVSPRFRTSSNVNAITPPSHQKIVWQSSCHLANHIVSTIQVAMYFVILQKKSKPLFLCLDNWKVDEPKQIHLLLVIRGLKQLT